jgi:ribonuclease HI
MNHYTLFSDVSVNPQKKLGMGAYLLLPYSYDELMEDGIENPHSFANQIKSKIFENTSSTKAEIQTLLWALSDIGRDLIKPFELTVCTDSQGITSLIARKQKLISSNFKKNDDEQIRNALLYAKFYEMQELINFDIVKIKGHSPKSQKDNLQLIFTIIDRKVRKDFKEYIRVKNE